MKNVIFNEKRDIEKIINSGAVTIETVNKVIMSIAKYNLRVLEMDDEDNKANIHQWLKKYYAEYVETAYDSIISEKVKNAHKYNLIYSDDLLIYQSELDTISNLDDIRAEKVLFALLCIAKLQRNMFNYQNGKYQMSLTNIFKLARVHIRSTERDLFMHELFKQGFISAPFIVNGQERWVNYICEEGESVLTISEQDFDELAYVYLNWKNDGKGYTRCQKCNRLMKQSKTKPKKYCEECNKIVHNEVASEFARNNYSPIGDKSITCIDCGKEVVVTAKDTATCRCEECQNIARKEKYAKYNARRRGLTTDQILTESHTTK